VTRRLALWFTVAISIGVVSGVSAQTQPIPQTSYSLAPWSQLQGGVTAAYFGNLLLPGLLQTSNGQTEGYYYMVGGPLTWGGQYLLYDYLRSPSPSQREWERGLGEIASTIGFSTMGYSYLSWERGLTNSRVGSAESRPVESYLTLLAAPYRGANALRWDTLGLVGFETMASYTPSDWAAMYDFFSKPDVDFFGARVRPLAGLAFVSLFSLGINLFAAVGEETFFRGFANDAYGVVPASIGFGLAHLANGFIYSQEKENYPWLTAILQSTFAGLFGFYASYVNGQDGYSLQRSVALHYWNNVAAIILDYLATGGTKAGL